ncbi:hypothetical protein [Candidatus Thioglobus autotrophicus]|uniref:hypothetical protein n=1 Tax=Candidatus Thioglobus autotrophicus TaxID=1705394 RepID=UPI00299D3040|nr:hypothetical protein [Candidatus Thioglobus autotrophicus]WPE18528.1 hypothetical protein R5P05_02690 [Candidatus Thioglobus autotrophicus]
MKNITATVEFDYKAQHYKLSSEIDIETIINQDNYCESIYLTIARENSVGLYSYELEIMMDQKIIFSDKDGYIQQCLNNGNIDISKLRDLHTKQLLTSVITELMDKYDLKKDDKNTFDALTDAYIKGKNS